LTPSFAGEGFTATIGTTPSGSEVSNNASSGNTINLPILHHPTKAIVITSQSKMVQPSLDQTRLRCCFQLQQPTSMVKLKSIKQEADKYGNKIIIDKIGLYDENNKWDRSQKIFLENM
jgi:hypothetical protein